MSGVVVWFTGLPSSGKSTLAREVRALVPGAVMLDSDDVRAALRPVPGYDDDARTAFYETLARLAALVASQGFVVLVPATAHKRAFRELAREVAPRFVEVFVDTPLEECKRRDAKGLYASGQKLVPGVGVAFEPPLAPDFVVRPADVDAAQHVVALTLPAEAGS